MQPTCLEEICEVLGAKMLPRAANVADFDHDEGAKNAKNPNSKFPLVESICTDTRQMKPGSLFIAIRGEHVDGHAYLSEAAAAGAVAAVVDEVPVGIAENLVLLRVADTRRAMGKLATFLRRRLRGKVIAVAGSNGKTSTKFLIGAVLGSRRRGSMSPKSYNNDIGVPAAIFPAHPEQDYLVLEMGTNHPGEIRVLTQMAEPDIAVITNCGLEHLEGLGDLDGVRRENAEMITGLSPTGMLVVNGDDFDLLAAVAGFSGERTTFGFEESNDLCVRDVYFGRDGTRFGIAGCMREWFVPMLGRHAAANSAAAIAVGRVMGLADSEIADALAAARGPEMRLQMVNLPGGVTVVNDAYNANPSSMRAALDTLAQLPASGRRIAILGDMRELGPASALHHRQIGTAAAEGGGIDRLVCVGADAAHIADAAIDAGMPAGAVERFADAPSAAAAVTALVQSGDLVLLKASRAMKLETIGSALADFATARQVAAASSR
ncbi:MAG TPA: UDP-N-acetylmuramoyl-tripeptide--D-alanyl-D-alanine ligase [Tepidisphaeraceae bacterium]|jgi:UDP-N-acetylmuramoyl-tripeptide--D-alanyl-D-alanine ligase|nr:UDP-N-acetylmuramoyl-tripeptide--D-alanyl-D-alanine ligase [Tepidisphaeraceae bacterium]